jgi:hypothetical protein
MTEKIVWRERERERKGRKNRLERVIREKK